MADKAAQLFGCTREELIGQRFEARGSPVITDGETEKVSQLRNVFGGRAAQRRIKWIPAPPTTGHDREWPRLTMTARGSLGALVIDLVGWAPGE